jgi:hypothetical protein
MPNKHKDGHEQFNTWLEPDAVEYVREVMELTGFNKSDAIRFLVKEARATYGSSKRSTEQKRDGGSARKGRGKR